MSVTAMASSSDSRPADAKGIEHLSYSSLTTYAHCPRKFYYRYIEHAAPEFVPAALAFGAAIHRAAEFIHHASLEGRPIPEPERLLKSFDEAWAVSTAGGIPVSYASQDDARSLRALAERMLSAYREHAFAASLVRPIRVLAIEHVERFQLLKQVPPLEMRVDLVALASNGDLVIADLKTSRSRWNEIKLREAIPQLVLYASGLIPMFRAMKAKRFVARFIVITKAKVPLIQELNAHIDQSDVDKLKRLVNEVWSGIQQEVFIQRPGWACAQCPYKNRCLG